MRIVGVGVGAPVSKSRSVGGPHFAARSKSSSLAAIAASHHSSGGGSTGLKPTLLHSSTTSRNGTRAPVAAPRPAPAVVSLLRSRLLIAASFAERPPPAPLLSS